MKERVRGKLEVVVMRAFREVCVECTRVLSCVQRERSVMPRTAKDECEEIEEVCIEEHARERGEMRRGG